MMVINLEHMLYFIVLGFVGAIAYVLVNSESYADFFKFDSVKRYIVGIVVGGIYDILYSDYNFPNSIMCIVAGYSGIHFIESVIERFTSTKP